MATESVEVRLTKSREILEPLGFEVHPFKIGWYNDKVDKKYKLPYDENTLAFNILSTPDMFENAFKPFICQHPDLGSIDPIDQCVAHCFDKVKQIFQDEDVEVMYDYEMLPNWQPKVLVQTAAHMAGAAYYYQKKDVKTGHWDSTKKISGVCVHPKYSGWFALRGVLIFRDMLCPELPYRDPPDVVPSNEKRIELLELYNFHWANWKFRDIIPSIKTYSDEQKAYFSKPPGEREEIIEEIIRNCAACRE